jgi:hypothetical protein
MERVDTEVPRRKSRLSGLIDVRLLTALPGIQASHGIDTILTLIRHYDNETRAEGIMAEITVADSLPKHRMKAPPIHENIQPHIGDTMGLSETGFHEEAFVFEL